MVTRPSFLIAGSRKTTFVLISLGICNRNMLGIGRRGAMMKPRGGSGRGRHDGCGKKSRSRAIVKSFVDIT